jgi:hypothetical protein
MYYDLINHSHTTVGGLQRYPMSHVYHINDKYACIDHYDVYIFI